MRRRKVSGIGVALAIALLLLGLTFYTPQQKATVLSLSQIYISPEGYEENGEYKGSYWVILMSADLNDVMAGFQFASDEEGMYIEDSTGKHYLSDTDRTVEEGLLDIEASLTIRIDPIQPYYLRPLEISSVTVAPRTYGAWQNKIIGTWGLSDDSVEPLYSGHWEWLEPSIWSVYTPFTVTLTKDDATPQSVTLNTEGGSRFGNIETAEGAVTITNLGHLGGVWGEPQLGDVLYFSDDHIYQADTNSRQLIAYDGGGTYTEYSSAIAHVQNSQAYSVYWYGYSRWINEEYSPSPRESFLAWFGDEKGGWIAADDAWSIFRDPVRGVIMDKSTLPVEKRPFMSLVEYLQHQRVKKISPDVFGAGAFKRTDNNLQINVPFNALGVGAPVFTIMIPTELVDTFIWKPQLSNVQVTDLSISDTIQDRVDASVSFKQESTVTSTAEVIVTFNPSDAPISAIPSSFSLSMAPNEIRTETFELVNTGTETERDVDVIVTVYNQLGMTSQEVKRVTLLPKTGAETLLTVYTRDAETKSRLSGIYVSVAWDSQSKGGYSDAGSYTFELGSITGQVKVRAEETDEYEDALTYVNLVAGSNTATLSLKPKGQNGGFDYTLLVVILVAVALIAVTFSQRRRFKKWT